MKERKLHLTVSSPEKELFDGEISVITLPGSAGSFNVLPNHAPIVSSLKKGAIVYVLPDGSEHKVDIQGGFVEMSNGLLSVCVSL
ncbi:MAG: F0F1 ATP synthase subunit epsilon [Mediterranea sp.]|jgi:F-type H+-transporting ATPase subunit epsilon|nr:F0F1 ATP synthase subunit epsilon [Mediterranea sp.]